MVAVVNALVTEAAVYFQKTWRAISTCDYWSDRPGFYCVDPRQEVTELECMLTNSMPQHYPTKVHLLMNV